MVSPTPATKSSRFLRCFNTGIDDGDAVAAPSCFRQREGREGVVLKPAKQNDVVVGSRRRKECSCSFARIMRAVVFETPLAKKMRKKKNRHKSYRPAMIGGEEPTKTTTYPVKKSASESELRGSRESSSLTETLTGSSSSSLNIASGSTVSSSSLISTTGSTPSRNPPTTRETQLGTIIGLFSVLLSLIAVILWGKACVIFWTSACLFVVPRMSRPVSEFSPPGSSPEINADEEKKIVTDGFGDRGRDR